MSTKKNTSKWGSTIELKARKILEAEGYIVFSSTRKPYRTKTGYGSHANDVFGCIDLVGKKKGRRTLWVQVHAGTNIGKKIADVSEVPWNLNHDRVEVWRWIGKRSRVNPRTGQPLRSYFFARYPMDDGFEQLPDSEGYAAVKEKSVTGTR